MRYPSEIIEEVRLGNDIIDLISGYTQLKPKGQSYFGVCPFHKEATPSFSVSADKQLYHCFGCGASGTVINFVMSIENYSFLDAIEYLANRINYTLPDLSKFEDKHTLQTKARLYEIHKLVARKYYENLLSSQGEVARKYLSNRKISPSIAKKFGIGYSVFQKGDIYNFLKEKGFSTDDILASGLVLKNKKEEFFDRFFGRLMFPIIDVQGRIIGFGGREINGYKNTAKYLNSPDTLIFNKSYNLYGLNFARLSKSKEFILVEGYVDVIALHQANFVNAVASLGTAFNDNHARVLKKYVSKAILLFDNDEAGAHATLRALPVLKKNGIECKVLELSGAKDPDEFIKKFGVEKFDSLINNSKNSVIFEIEQKLKEFDLKDLGQKIQFTKEVAKIISKLSSSIEQDVYIKEASKLTNISFDAISEEIKNISQNFSINLSKTKYNKLNTNNKEINKVNMAREGLLYIISNNKHIFDKLQAYILPEEFLDPDYVSFAKIIYEYLSLNKNVYPAEIINKFKDTNLQQKISKIFMQRFDFNKLDSIEKLVNDYLKIIKKEYIDNKIQECIVSKNLDTLPSLIKDKKYIDEMYISF